MSPGGEPRQLRRILEGLADPQAIGALSVGDVVDQGRSPGAIDAGNMALAIITPLLHSA
ncbi:MAG: hypothetical protein RMJ55_00200 [Roseiflexaceae bacterium]|nr:hypothetical protein [Roseiflexus sp.]MDW8211949.1 hypothetical protein [Roseiflexaceae bacterium]